MHRSWAFFCSCDLKSTYCVFCYLEVTKLWSLGGSVGLFLDLRFHILQPDVFCMLIWEAYTKYPISMHISMHNVEKFLDLENHITLPVEIQCVVFCSFMANFPVFPGRSQILQMPINPLNFLPSPTTHKYTHTQKNYSHTYLHFWTTDNKITDLENCKKSVTPYPILIFNQVLTIYFKLVWEN